MWSDLQKRVFHTHSIYQLWQFIISDCNKLLIWNFISMKYRHSLMTGEKFQLRIFFDNQVMVFQVQRIECVWKTPFHKSGHIFVYHRCSVLEFWITNCHPLKNSESCYISTKADAIIHKIENILIHHITNRKTLFAW